jgi:spermidine synthase
MGASVLPTKTAQHEVNHPAVGLGWYFGFFVVSGCCGLIYEVVWLRLAMASFGVTTALASIVISMFMAGLGLGSWGAGKAMRRSRANQGRNVLRLYALAEFLVGLSSIAVPFQLRFGRVLLQHMGGAGVWQSSEYYAAAGLLIAIALVPWCTCMGATFPLLMAVIRQTAAAKSERSFSYLYLANVLGALVGTLGSAFVSIEFFGFQGTLHIAGALNAALALSAFTLSSRVASSAAIEDSAPAAAPRPSLYGLPRAVIPLFLLTTGLVCMGMEVVWIRQFTPYLGNVVYCFAGILAVYLLATVMGSRDYRANAATRDPEESSWAWSIFAFSGVLPVVAADPALPLGPLGIGVVRLFSIALFCALAGYLTPLLVDCWSAGDPDRAGSAYAVNIAGSIAGPLVAGFWLLPWLGERWSILAFSIPLFFIAGLAAIARPAHPAPPRSALKSRLRFGSAIAAAALLFAISRDFAARFPSAEVRRDYTATVIATGSGMHKRLLVNGVGMTTLSPITKYIVHLPAAMLSTRPRNGLVICFGMGTSFRSMLSWGIPTTAVELVPSVPPLFPYFHSDAARLTASPLAHIVVDDGRRFLDGSPQTYDIIVTDPPPPPQAPGSSLLYSREFYEVVKRHLSKGGIFQAWYPKWEATEDSATTVAVAKALMQSFPYVRAFPSYDGKGIHFLASMEPIPSVSGSVLAARMPPAAAADFVEWGPEAAPAAQFDRVLSHELSLNQIVAADPGAPAIQDDQPINEYFLMREWFHTSR